MTSFAVRGSAAASASSVAAPAATRAASSRVPRAACLPSSFASVLAPQVRTSSTASSFSGSNARRAVAPRVLEKAAAHHRQRRRDPVELQVISLARSERLAVAVGAIGRQADVDRVVRIDQRRSLGAG